MAARPNRQLSLGPLHLTNAERGAGRLRKPETLSEAEALREASMLFDAAMTRAKVRNQDLAYVLGVSENLVQRWRNPECREVPNFGHQLRLPMAVQWALFRELNLRNGFGQAALAQLTEAAGLLAVGLE